MPYTIFKVGLFVDDAMLSQSVCDSDMVLTENDLQERVQDLEANEVVCLGAINFTLTQSITLITNNVTIRGQGQEKTTIRCSTEVSPALIIRYEMFIQYDNH